MIIYSVAKGIAQRLESIPDEMFSMKVMGDGMAIKPEENWIYSPVDGTVTMIFETKHAIGITANDGTEVLIHIGVDTVNLHGKPFDTYVHVNDKVKEGELLMSSDFKMIEEKNLCASIMTIVTNRKVKILKSEGSITKDEPVLEVIEA
ncbi:PTS sugar transporter subunit IIA [Anaerorhabdus sp.]